MIGQLVAVRDGAALQLLRDLAGTTQKMDLVARLKAAGSALAEGRERIGKDAAAKVEVEAVAASAEDISVEERRAALPKYNDFVAEVVSCGWEREVNNFQILPSVVSWFQPHVSEAGGGEGDADRNVQVCFNRLPSVVTWLGRKARAGKEQDTQTGMWACNFCARRFKKYEIALAHEIICPCNLGE